MVVLKSEGLPAGLPSASCSGIWPSVGEKVISSAPSIVALPRMSMTPAMIAPVRCRFWVGGLL